MLELEADPESEFESVDPQRLALRAHVQPLYFANGDIAHICPSGNAPQPRIHAVANTEARAEDIVA